MSAAADVPRLWVLHPSDEMYGADKVLLETLAAIDGLFAIRVLLPQDVSYEGKQLSRRLADLGIDFQYVDFPVLRRQHLNVRGLLALARRFFLLWNVLRQSKPDLLYLNTSAVAPATILGRLTGAHVIVHLHEYLGDTLGRTVSAMLQPAHQVLAVSQAVQNELPEPIRRRSRVLHNGFSLPAPINVNPAGPTVFLLASRWNAWKGHREVLRAWDLMSSENVQLRILGGPPPAGEAADVHAMVSRMARRHTVEIVGEVTDVRHEIDRSHVVLVPSIRPDPLPTIAIEAAAAGRPVLAPASGGLPEIIEDGVTGWILGPSTEAQKWAAAMDRIEVETVSAMSESCRQRFETKFSRSRFSAEISEVFGTVATVKSDPRKLT